MIWFLNKRAALLPPRMGNLQFGSYIKSGGYRLGRTRGKATGTSMAAHHRDEAMYINGRTEEEVVSLYEEWLVKHGKVYNTLEEKDKRFQIFKDNLRLFDKVNSANRGGSTVGLGPFTDLTNKEFKARFSKGGYRLGRTRGKATGTSMAAHHRDEAMYINGRTEEEVVSLYEEWLVKHGKVYNTLEEKDKRFQIFKDNLRLFDKVNSANRGGFTVGLGPFTDLTNKEFKERFSKGRTDPNRR